MRVKRHLVAIAIGAALVWFTHPTEGARRRADARRLLERCRADVRQRVTGWAPEPDAGGFLPPSPATMTEVLNAGRGQGFTAELSTTPEASIRCGACGIESAPDSFTRAWLHRLEGSSDPDELVTISALQCPACGAKGLLTLPLGPRADEIEAEVARSLPDPERGDMAPLQDQRVAV